MNRHKQTGLLLSLLVLPVFVMFLSHNFFPANYLFSSLYKILFLFPVFYGVAIEKIPLKKALFQYFSLRQFKKEIWLKFAIGVGMMGLYLGSFFLFKDFLDLESVVSRLKEAADINVNNLIFIGLYIIVANSLLEEYFWRGFLFNKFNKLIRPWTAHLLTGVAFSFHHVMFYYNWFDYKFFIIITIGLSAYAIVMNLIFSRYKDLFSCWLVHAFADIAQISIAFIIFDLI